MPSCSPHLRRDEQVELFEKLEGEVLKQCYFKYRRFALIDENDGYLTGSTSM